MIKKNPKKLSRRLTDDPLLSVQLPKQVVDFECPGGLYVTPRRPPSLDACLPDAGWPDSSSY